MKKLNILMVCLGNICRSPLAEGILSEKLIRINNTSTVDSAGTGAWHIGQPPDLRSIATARKYHIDITGQRARKININDFDNFDLIFTMDKDVHQDVVSMVSSSTQKNKIFLLLEYAGNSNMQNVPDPYQGGITEFDEVFHLLDKACGKIVEKLFKMAD